MRRELDFSRLKTDWARKLGKGLIIYFPANRRLLKGYIEVLRQAIYKLSTIEAGRVDALPIDDALDGVYATLFTDQILFYNSKDRAVTRTVEFTADQLADWRGLIVMPKQNTWTVTIPPHGMEAIRFTPEPQELLYECEDFSQLNGLKPVSAPECSPGTGKTCVVLPKGAVISTGIQVEVSGQYAIYSRCTRGGRLEPPELLVDDQQIKPLNIKNGQTLLMAVVSLSRGKHILTLRARPDRDLRADFVVLTNDPTVAGFDFVYRRPVFDPSLPSP
jgi:hypothetical protein